MILILNFILTVFLSSFAAAYDCQNVPPFTPLESQSVKISVGRFYWSIEDGTPIENVEDVCTKRGAVFAYDVRGRETDAYYCLKPQTHEVFSCPTTLNGQAAEIAVLPATWIRTWNPSDVREYRFHAYVMDVNHPDIYLDVFSRTLSFDLAKGSVITEGAIKNGPGDAKDGFFIRVEFQK